MPSKNRVKSYVANSYYHLYNRGVEKRDIFLDEQDYNVFLSYLRTYLLPKDEIYLQQVITSPESSITDRSEASRLLRLNNFSDNLRLISFCLMPNHFHLLIHQTEETVIDRFMKSLWTRYVMYFNRRHKRIGPLFQDLYKAVLLNSDEQFLWLTRYIHRNPLPLLIGTDLRNYKYSSYQHFLGIKKEEWIHSEDILIFFSQGNFGVNSYLDFVEQKTDEASVFEQIGELILE